MKRLQRWNRQYALLLACLLPGGAAVLAGCGNGSPATTARAAQTGTLRIDIDWPAAQTRGTRLIPPSANSIVFDLTDSRFKTLVHRVVARPTGQTTTQTVFADLPLGEVLVVAAAYPQADGSGTAQANATARVQVQPAVTVDVTLTLASRIDHLDITPVNVSLPIGQRASFTVTPRDIEGNVVMVAPDAITWKLTDTTVATLTTRGDQAIVQGQQAGTTGLTATDNDTQLNGAATINVVVPVSPNGSAAINLH